MNTFRYESTEPTVIEIENAKLSRKAACESIILLKNSGILPLDNGVSVGLFGGGVHFTVKGGTGSGDVNERERVSIYEGFKNTDCKITNNDYLNDYKARYTKAREDWKTSILDQCKEDPNNFFDAYVGSPFSYPNGRKIEKNDVENTDVAVYVISRIAGEGADRKNKAGDYELSESEIRDLEDLKSFGKKVILIINAGGPVDLKCIHSNEAIGAILFISQLGQEGGNAVCDVLFGKVTPSAKLTATWAVSYSDYPDALNYSSLNGNLDEEFYTDGIYVGYRYFSSFGVKPAYPFGFGLSYTDFSFKNSSVKIDKDVIVSTTVLNIGEKFTGKEVVEVYAILPQTGIEKEKQRLIGFAKTKELGIGEEQEITISISSKNFASFDENKSAWVIEKGKYGIAIGNSSDNISIVSVLCVNEDCIIEKVTCVFQIEDKYKDSFTEISREIKEDSQFDNLSNNILQIEYKPLAEVCEEYTPDDIDTKVKEITNQLSAEEWIPLLYGEMSKGAAALGNAAIHVPGAAGETSGAFIDKVKLPAIILADGPAGLRLQQEYEINPENNTVYDTGFLGSIEGGFFAEKNFHEGAKRYYQYCTSFPVGTALAQTWNVELLETIGQAVAKEMEHFNISLWLAPGMNIQKNPLCGRNFEYYSEDPLLTGKIAAAITYGVQTAKGRGTTIKHYACNNQEDNRMGVNVIISERALREIYLRGFEIAVKEAQPKALMSSYNLINGTHAANNKGLLTEVLRNEWGFRGIVMTDWATTMPVGGSISHLCTKAGNDLIMPGYIGDDEDIRKALKNGDLTETEIKICVERLINTILRANI